ncbi:Ascus wall endo-1,3(4)-beta-glucanase [Phytophthora ramorum]|uniref:Ascus wall endo-1,3(4)-beta-glucanase n=1 Tax=Phytophthora ramorum TaxID=164328 RepID=UPI0030A39F6C|nr:Ascus wall endo-1,3(4)-beta-glucanase [Phytophthora ramorum]
MKFSVWAKAAVATVVAARTARATLDDPDVGEGFNFQDGTVESATEKLIGTLAPNTPATTTNTQQDSTSGGYFQAFGTEEPSKELFKRNGTLAKLAPIINVAEEALNQPIPTNKWWGNLIHVTATNRSENYPAWAQPYSLLLPKQAPYGIQTCYPYTYREIAPEVNGTVKWYTHGIHNDLTLSATQFFNSSKPNYEVYSWSDIGVNLRTCDEASGKCMDSALVSGMAFVSAKYDGLTPRIDTEHDITAVDDSAPGKFVIHLNNSQTWVLYASDKSISFRVEDSVVFSVNASGSSLVADAGYSGTIRVALLPDDADDTVYDEFASCMVLGGSVSMESRTGYSLHWATEGNTCDTVGLLHFALPHQVESLSGSPTTAGSQGAIVMHSTTRGKMIGQISTTWTFVEPEADFEVDFYPAKKPSPWVVLETDMLRTLQKDIIADWKLDADSWYYNGKYFQKYASLCLMAADSSVVGPDTTLLSYCLEKLETLIEPMLNNTLSPPLVYETLYRGVVSSLIFKTGWLYMDFGSGIYNDHHYHFGYFVTASAILKHLDPNWSRMPELETIIWTMLRDVANPSLEGHYFPRFRHFSWYHGHSYSRGVTLLDNGKDEESTSEDVNFYYGMTLWGKVTGHKAVEDLGSLMLRLNAHAIRTYFLLQSDNTIHPPAIVRNHVTGIFFDNKVYYNTWFLDEKYAIHGIQMIPVSPINELARTSTFVEQEWNDILSKEKIVTMKNSNNTWLSLLLVNAATVDPVDSLHKLKNATMDDGLSRSWALYNAATRCRDGVKTVGLQVAVAV